MVDVKDIQTAEWWAVGKDAELDELRAAMKAVVLVDYLAPRMEPPLADT